MDPVDPLSAEGFAALVRRVRRTADEELAEIEYETERAEQKRLDLTSRSMQAMMEGERWLVSLGSRTVEGAVVHVGMNFVGLQDRAGNLHDIVHAAISTVRIVEVRPADGRAPITTRPASFMARLLSLEQIREVEIGGRDGTWALEGVIDSVNSDHLVLEERTKECSIVPLASIGYLGRVAAEPRRQTRHRRPVV